MVFCVNKRISTKYYKNVSRVVLIMKKDDCIFCKLANGIIPTNSLYEDDIVNVIFDANPASEGHVLILPKNILIIFILWMIRQRHMYFRLLLR